MTVYEWLHSGYPIWLLAGLAVASLLGWVIGTTEQKWTEREQQIAERRERRKQRP